MISLLKRRALLVSLGLAAAFFPLAGCGGGGGGGGSGTGTSPTLLSITAQGSPTPLWTNLGGVATPAPTCAPNLPLNAIVTFTFGGPVSPASLPASGQATGSINITALDTSGATPQTIAALGNFVVTDDPTLPAGNNRVVTFTPILPSDPTNPTAAGLNSARQYTIFMPRGGNGGQVLQVAGRDVDIEAVTCFNSCDTTPNPQACFSDQIPGAPFIVSTVPASVNSATTPVPMIDPSAVVDNRVIIYVSEPLDPTNVNLSNVRLVNSATGAQVPGMVEFLQNGSFVVPSGVPTTAARIDYVASSQLLSNVTYEVVFDPSVTDFGQNAVVAFNLPAGTPQPPRQFATNPVPFIPQQPLIDNFSSSGTLDPTTSTELLQWGGGRATITFPAPLVGDGTDGALVYMPGNHDIYTGGLLTPTQTSLLTASPCSAPSPVGLGASFQTFADGIVNATSINVMAGANIRCYGNYPLHWRVLGNVTIDGKIDGSAFRTGQPACYTLFLPALGQFNNGGTTSPSIVRPSVGGPGAGRGGRASQLGGDRTAQGEGGFGAYIDGVENIGATPNPFFGGGQGGRGDFFNTASGLMGGQGGAGGSAFSAGSDGDPRTGSVTTSGLAGCPGLLLPPPLAPALASSLPSSFIFPIGAITAGSGGGGGGDKYDASPPGSLFDEQGGAGGGGGGGFRVSAVGQVTLNGSAEIRMEGAAGTLGPTFAGAGSAGSGGLVWLQSFQQVQILNLATISAAAGGGPVGTLSCVAAPGTGGRGLVQLEDSDGIINTAFIGGCGAGTCNTGPTSPHNVGVETFPFSSTVSATGTSQWLDTGYGDPQITAISETFSLGTVAGSMVTIRYQGAFESVTQPGTPDIGNTSPLVPATQISSDPAIVDPLDGFRFIRFIVTFQYNSPPASAQTDVFPDVTNITINYSTPDLTGNP